MRCLRLPNTCSSEAKPGALQHETGSAKNTRRSHANEPFAQASRAAARPLVDLLPDQKLPWITARWRGTIRALRASSRLSILDSSTSCPPMSCMPVTSNRAVFNYNPSVSHRTGQIWGSFNFAPHILYSAGLSKAFPLRKPKLGGFT